jgi:asparagine synthase (glutamine-hydrolysing)
MQIGYSVVSRPTEIAFEIRGPVGDDQSQLVTFSQDGEVAVALMGRLYYRQDSLDSRSSQSRAELPDRVSPDDATLALIVYREQGIRGLERLEGDFGLVLWDGNTSQLVGVRDPMGGYPLFWSEKGETTIFGTSMVPILDVLQRRSLCSEYLADFVMMPGQRNEGPGELCVYEGVRRIPAGGMVIVNLLTRTAERRVNWEWLNRATDPGQGPRA